MSRLHVHVTVDDLESNIAFYTAVFGSAPVVRKPDYAKWMVDDPKVNFAISSRGRAPGLDHLGLQAEDETELAAMRARLEDAGIQGLPQTGATCCYARSDKYWVTDPQGIAWETFHTLAQAPLFGESADTPSAGACCTPAASGRCAG